MFKSLQTTAEEISIIPIDIRNNVVTVEPMRSTVSPAAAEESREFAEWIQVVKQSVGALQFGVVQIVVHNGKVVQIEKTEKLRLDQQAH